MNNLMDIANKLRHLKVLTIPVVARELGISEMKSIKILYELEIKGILKRKEQQSGKKTFRFWFFKDENYESDKKEHNINLDDLDFKTASEEYDNKKANMD